MANAKDASDLLACARARDSPTLSLCGGGGVNRCCAHGHVAQPFVLNDAVWGFSLEILQSHINSASIMERLCVSIDLVFVEFINASSGGGGGSARGGRGTMDLRRLSSWVSVLTHFTFLVNTDLSGHLEVTDNRVSYRLPLFNKGGSAYTLEIFIHEEAELSCCDSVQWDLVCAITQQLNTSKSAHPLSSVLYASSWGDGALVDACVVIGDERNPLLAFIALAHVFKATGMPMGVSTY